MDFLRAAASAASAALAGSGGVPGLPGYTLGDRDTEYDGLSIWTLNEGLKKDDQSAVSIFSFDLSATPNRRHLLPLARNALRKLKTLRHPDVLKYLDGVESDASVWIVTERVTPLSNRLGPEGQMAKDGGTEEWKIWGLSRITNALAFINSSGASTHGNIRIPSIFLSPGGEWRIGGFEVLSSPRDSTSVLLTLASSLPNASRFVSPEVRGSGYSVLQDLEPHMLDSYQLHLFLYTLFNGPLPASFGSDASPALPPARGAMPLPLFQCSRRLGATATASRLKIETFHQIGMATEGVGSGFYSSNRLVRLAAGLDNFALASEGDRAVLIKMVKDSNQALPADFMAYKVLPALVRAFEHGPGGPQLLPLLLAMGSTLPPADYTTHLLQPVVRMFASPDRAMRLALLEGMPSYADKLENKVVVDKVWPHLLTGFTDVVPVIREATVKSILIIAPKLTDRILNNDLLRHLAKAQMDPEPGIRTNTCILLGRLSKHLAPTTNRKVLVPAFARALRDSFVHARIAGLMALMATVECYEREDLAGKVIPSMAICLVDKEKTVRDQAFKAIDMFVKRVEAQVADMPASVLPPPSAQLNGEVASTDAPGLATNAAGAAGALAGWAFTSLSKRLAAGDLESPIARPASAPPPVTLVPSTSSAPASSRPSTSSSGRPSVTISPPTASTSAFGLSPETGVDDWGGDLIDVNADADDWDAFESAQPSMPTVDPLAARLSIRKPVPSPAAKLSTKPMAQPRARPSTGSGGGSAALKLGGAGKTSTSLALALEAEAGGGADAWDLDDDASAAADEWTNGGGGTNGNGAAAGGHDDWGGFDDVPPPTRKVGANGRAEERRAKIAAAAASRGRGRGGLGPARKLGP